MKIGNKFNYNNFGKIYFMSDLHYNHPGILRHNPGTRNFVDVDEMNSWLSKNVWDVISEDDIVFDLGDTFWNMDCSRISTILGSVKGTMYKVMGNHDKYGLYYDQAPLNRYYRLISDLLDIVITYDGIDYRCTLSHYPLVTWNHKARGSFMLHGHCHGNIDDYNKLSPDLRVDIGMDGSLCNSLGSSPLIDFSDILRYFLDKSGGKDFKEYALNNCSNL